MARRPVKLMQNQTVTRDHYRNGALHRETPVVNGVLHGTVRAYHNNGKLASEEPYEKGLVHGVCRRWAWSGKLLGCYTMEHGTGIQQDWYENGQLSMEISTVAGEFTGRQRHWLADGTLVSDEYLVDGAPVTRQEYYAAAVSDSRFPNYDDENFEPIHLEGPEIERKYVELLVAVLLDRPNHAEARDWLAHGGPNVSRTLGRFPNCDVAMEIVNGLYAAGASSVIALDNYGDASTGEFCDRIAIQLPEDARLRQQIRDACRQIVAGYQGAFLPDSDFAEKCLYFLLA